MQAAGHALVAVEQRGAEERALAEFFAQRVDRRVKLFLPGIVGGVEEAVLPERPVGQLRDRHTELPEGRLAVPRLIKQGTGRLIKLAGDICGRGEAHLV